MPPMQTATTALCCSRTIALTTMSAARTGLAQATAPPRLHGTSCPQTVLVAEGVYYKVLIASLVVECIMVVLLTSMALSYLIPIRRYDRVEKRRVPKPTRPTSKIVHAHTTARKMVESMLQSLRRWLCRLRLSSPPSSTPRSSTPKYACHRLPLDRPSKIVSTGTPDWLARPLILPPLPSPQEHIRRFSFRNWPTPQASAAAWPLHRPTACAGPSTNAPTSYHSSLGTFFEEDTSSYRPEACPNPQYSPELLPVNMI